MANFTTNENLYKWSPTDEKTETITEMANNADKIDAKFVEVDNAITTVETDITNLETGKTDKTGDHLGTWHGLTPELADPGISSVVSQHTVKLDDHTTQLADMAIQVESYGAIGDGTTSDSIAFQNAINKALTTKNPTIRLQTGKIYLLKASDIANYSGISIIGNGAIIKLNGNVTFNLQNLNSFTCTDLNISTDVGLTEDSTTLNGYTMFYHTDTTKKVSYNIKNVFAQSTVSQTPKISRYPVLFSMATVKEGSSFKNIAVDNFRAALFIADGKKFSVEHVYGTNAETLVWINGGDEIGVFNVAIKNTQAQALTWLCKNNGFGVQGCDTLLTGATVKNLTIENIKGEFCVERVLYCQGSNVFANNLLAVNCQGFKFCGARDTEYQKNVVAKNLTSIVNDDLTTASTAYRTLELYYISNVRVDNVLLNNFRTDKKTNVVGTHIVIFSDGAKDIVINNVETEVNTNQPLFYFTWLLDKTKALNNIKISNVKYTNHGSFGNNYLLECGADVPVGWVNGLTLENVTVTQNPTVVTNNTLLSNMGELFTKKIIGLTLKNVDVGYMAEGQATTQTDPSFISDNIISTEVTHSYLSKTSASTYRASYTTAQSSGVGTLYLAPSKGTQKYYAYYIHSSYDDKIITIYENQSTTAKRFYDSIKSVEFDMLLDTITSWNLPVNTTGSSYLVEVESSLGCGKAIFSGNTVTEIYKTGNCVFDTTASKLQVKPFAGSGTDFSVYVYNNTGTGARVKVKIVKI